MVTIQICSSRTLAKTKTVKLSVLLITKRYISFSKDIKVYNYTDKETRDDVYIELEIRFIDGFKFMSSSLDNLASNLANDQFKNLESIYEEQLELLKHKGVYPCDYVDSFKKVR